MVALVAEIGGRVSVEGLWVMIGDEDMRSGTQTEVKLLRLVVILLVNVVGVTEICPDFLT